MQEIPRDICWWCILLAGKLIYGFYIKKDLEANVLAIYMIYDGTL